MKRKRIAIGLLIALAALGGVGLRADQELEVMGDYSGGGTLNHDLVVIGGSVFVLNNDLIIHGDLKVTAGRVVVDGGNLKVHGDVIVTNTLPSSQTPYANDATITVTGNLEVTGAIITKSSNGDSFVEVWDAFDGQEVLSRGGHLYAGRISARGDRHAYVWVDHYVTVTDSIVTKAGEVGNAFVRSNGDLLRPGYYGDIYAGSIYTDAQGGRAEVHVEDGHLEVNGAIITRAYNDAYVWTEGNIRAGSIFAWSSNGDALISGEQIIVNGDIRTESLSGHAYVKARMTLIGGLWGTFEDIIAQNIYTRGYLSGYVNAYRNLEVKGDIVAIQKVPPLEIKGDIVAMQKAPILRNGEFPVAEDAVVQADQGRLYAQNVITRSTDGDASVRAYKDLWVTGDIITKSDQSNAIVWKEAYGGHLRAGNIATEGYDGAYVEAIAGDIDVTHVISTKSNFEAMGMPGRCYASDYATVVAYDGDLFAEKIFTNAFYEASIASIHGNIGVKGPIVTRSYYNKANISAFEDIKAGSISTHGKNGSEMFALGSIEVREDISTKSDLDDAYVVSENGDVRARSIKTDSEQGDGSIIAAPGSAYFQFVPVEGNAVKELKNCEFNFVSDHELSRRLDISGTCTINGCGHHLKFVGDGEIVVKADSTLLIKNIKLSNLKNANTVSTADISSKLKLQDVKWMQVGDVTVNTGSWEVFGDLIISGSDTKFRYASGRPMIVHDDSRLFFDRGTEVEVGSGGIFLFYGAKLHFDGSRLRAITDVYLRNGTLVWDNFVTMYADAGKTIYFGTGNPVNNLTLQPGKMAKLSFSGVVNNNV